MKRLLAFVLGMSLLLAPIQALAVEVILRDQPLYMDQPAILEDGRTLVPMRAIFEALGAEITWEPNSQMVTGDNGSIFVSLVIGDRMACVNGVNVPLDVPAKIVNGRTLVPLRFVSEASGSYVEWYEPTQTVYIDSFVPSDPSPSSKLQWAFDTYCQEATADPAEGTWYTSDEDYDYYIFSKHDEGNTYDLARIVFQKYPEAIAIFTTRAGYHWESQVFTTDYEVVAFYEGPPIGFHGMNRHHMRISGDTLIHETSWNSGDEIPSEWNNWQTIDLPYEVNQVYHRA